MLLLFSLPHDAAAGPVYVGSQADPTGDTFFAGPGPDIVFAGIVADDFWVTFTMQFAPGTWDQTTTKSTFSIDADQNDATGSFWNDLGVDFTVGQGYFGDTGTAYLKGFPGNVLIGSTAVTFLTNGVEYSFARALFGAEDGLLDFVAAVQITTVFDESSPIGDFAPSIEQRGIGAASTVAAVPEPATFAMLAGGLSLLSVYRKRRTTRDE